MNKYTQIFTEMIEYNKDLFDSFKLLHDKYQADPKAHQTEFNVEGEKVLRIIRRYENILCGKSENGRYGKFSTSLSEKFWTKIRQMFPLIDSIGVLT